MCGFVGYIDKKVNDKNVIKLMNDTIILLTDRSTNSGENVKANISTSKDWVHINLIDKINLTISIPKNAMLQAIEENK